MTGKTHAAAGAFAGALAGKALGDPFGGMALGALAALLPDVDHPGSWAGRRLRPVSVVLEAAAGHRTVAHTVWFCLGVSALFAFAAAFLLPYASVLPFHLPWWPAPGVAGLYALVGSLSHLALDACTRSGVEPLAPLVPFRLRGPLETGDPIVEVPAAAMLALAALRLAGVL